jgi:hypothetical protein
MSEITFVARIGLDWADKKHDFCLSESGSQKYKYGTFLHTPVAINQWATSLSRRFDGQPIAICLELKSGPIVSCLLKYAFITLFFVPPKALAKYRDVFHQSGAKDDPTDAFLQLDYLIKHPERLRKITVDDEDTRIIQQLVEQRKFFIDERIKQTNRIAVSLKAYYPLVLQLFNDMDTYIFCEFVKRWPNLTKLKGARKRTLIEFFRAHFIGRKNIINQRLKFITAAVALTDDPAIMIPQQQYTLSLIKQLEISVKTTKDYDKQIAYWFSKHKDKDIFESFPGAGPVLAPRLLAAFGSDRTRFSNASEVHNYAAISPVTVRSGTKCWVHWRYKCSTFLRQTFVEWAYQTTRFSYWAKVYYDNQRAQGKSHQAVLRALAYKWIRILYRCWQNKVKYNETAYLLTLDHRQSKLKKIN